MTDAILPKTSTKLLFLGGLPGSGKSFGAKHLSSQGWILFDDFQSKAIYDSPNFHQSRHYKQLVSHLRNGERCIVSDIRVIDGDYRDDAKAALCEAVGKIATEWHLFANDPEQCRENVRNSRDARRMQERLAAIDVWTKKFSAPGDAILHPVWRPSSGLDSCNG